MEVKWTDIAQAIGSLGGCIIALFGVIAVLRQIKQLQSALHGDTHAKLHSQNFEVLRILTEDPGVLPYFYANKSITESDAEYRKVSVLAEIVADYLEHISLQKVNLPPDVWERWQRYILHVYSMSPVVRQHFRAHPEWYTESVLSLFPNEPLDALGASVG